MGAKINDAVIATIKQEFMAGASLRELAVKHGVSLRTLAARSKTEEWAVARDLQQTATAVPALVKAADMRAETVNANWRDVVEGLLGDLMEVSRRSGELLRQSDLSRLDPRELATLIKILGDSAARLAELNPASVNKPRQLNFEMLKGKPIDVLIDYANRGLIAEME